MNILPDIIKCEDNQTTKFGQLIEYNLSNNFHKNYTENEAEGLVPDLSFTFKKAFVSQQKRSKAINIF